MTHDALKQQILEAIEKVETDGLSAYSYARFYAVASPDNIRALIEGYESQLKADNPKWEFDQSSPIGTPPKPLNQAAKLADAQSLLQAHECALGLAIEDKVILQMQLKTVLDREAATQKRHDDRIDALEAKLWRISRWCEAYPLEVFPAPDLEADRKLLGDSEFTRLNAAAMRHVVEGIALIAKERAVAKETQE